MIRLMNKGSDVNTSLSDTLRDNPIALVLIIYSIAAACFIWGLFGYHTYLILTNQTTNEQLKKAWKLISGNPYRRY